MAGPDGRQFPNLDMSKAININPEPWELPTPERIVNGAMEIIQVLDEVERKYQFSFSDTLTALKYVDFQTNLAMSVVQAKKAGKK